jgi:hypothetical protein
VKATHCVRRLRNRGAELRNLGAKLRNELHLLGHYVLEQRDIGHAEKYIARLACLDPEVWGW